jgi:ABC-type multidrug transport system permease subunit
VWLSDETIEGWRAAPRQGVAYGYTQIMLILAVAFLVFRVPVEGSVLLLLGVLGLFILCNLALGFTFSTLAVTQMQALQMAQFFFLPSMLLSGFIFPFHGMPGWAQVVGEILPLTHTMRISRGILLKGNGVTEIWPDVWPLALFAVVAVVVAVRSFRETLD